MRLGVAASVLLALGAVAATFTLVRAFGGGVEACAFAVVTLGIARPWLALHAARDRRLRAERASVHVPADV